MWLFLPWAAWIDRNRTPVHVETRTSAPQNGNADRQ
jgi:hypothetical protein